MGVLIEALSVIVRCDAIVDRYQGGMEAFMNSIPNCTVCADSKLVRIGFMMPDDARQYVTLLEKGGLIFTQDNKAVDIVIFDQITGSLASCDWVECAEVSIAGGAKIIAAWFDNGSGVFSKSNCESGDTDGVAVPKGWEYIGSMSEQPRRINEEEQLSRLTYLDTDGVVDSYRDNETGETVYIGRPRKH